MPVSSNAAPTLTTLITFNGANGGNPSGSLIADASGNLFGTTADGGTSGRGTVFEIAKTSTGYGALTTLVSFTTTDGSSPYASLIADASGNLFGTTEMGGAFYYGTVFEIAKTSTDYGALATLISFTGVNGAFSQASLIPDASGNLFGTTYSGGASGDGTVFEIVKTSTGYGALTTLATFYGPNGVVPLASLIADASGNLFGTTSGGGASNQGTVFEVPKTNGGYGALANLATFTGTNGTFPVGGLIADASGNLFGTTDDGGAFGYGTVFEVPKTSAGYGVLTTLVTFSGTNGAKPRASLIADASGNLFGTTEGGGASGDGTVFEIPKTSTGYGAPTTVISFNGTNGADPLASLISDPSGNLFGTTSYGGTSNVGTAFEITNSGFQPFLPPTISGTAAGQATHSEAQVHPFSGVAIGDTNAGATDTLTITLSGAGGSLTDGSSFSGLTSGAAGSYSLTGTAAAVTAELDALIFTPKAGAAGTTSTTSFTLSALSSGYATPTVDNTTTVIDSDPGPTVAWQSGVTGGWSNAANWVGGVLPTALNAVTFGGTGIEEITITSLDVAASLTVTDPNVFLRDTGTLTLTGALDLAAGAIEIGDNYSGLAGAIVAPGGIIIESGAQISNQVVYRTSTITGNVVNNSTGQPGLQGYGAQYYLNSGLLVEGNLAITGSLTGSGTTFIFGSLEVQGAVSQTIDVASGATLRLDDPADFTGSISGIAAGNFAGTTNLPTPVATTIDLSDVAPGAVSYSHGTLSGTDTKGKAFSLAVTGQTATELGDAAFVQTSDGHGGTNLSWQTGLTDLWVGGASGDWATGANWSLGFAPGAFDTALISGTTPITLSVAAEDASQANLLDITNPHTTLLVAGRLSLGTAPVLDAANIVIDGGTLILVTDGSGNNGLSGVGSSLDNATINLTSGGGISAFDSSSSGHYQGFLNLDLGANLKLTQIQGNEDIVSIVSETITNEGSITAGIAGGEFNIKATGNTFVSSNQTPTITNSGTIKVSNGDSLNAGSAFDYEAFVNAGAIDIDAGSSATLGGAAWSNTGTITVAAGATLTLDGYFASSSLTGISNQGTIILNVAGDQNGFAWAGGVITATGGTFVFNPDYQTPSPYNNYSPYAAQQIDDVQFVIDAGATLEFKGDPTVFTQNGQGAVTYGTVTFDGPGATLRIDALGLDPQAVLVTPPTPGDFNGAVLGLAIGDAIDFAGTSVTSASFSNGDLVLGVAGGTFSYGTDQSFTKDQITLASDGHGGTLLTLHADTTPPTVTSVMTGPGTRTVGHTEEIVLQMREATLIAGGTPTLSLSNGGTAVYDAARTAALGDPTRLIFDYDVASTDQSATAPTITAVQNHGATITDSAGNAANFAAAENTALGFSVDTTTATPSGDIYFLANDGTGSQVWMTDGTSGGTRKITLTGDSYANPSNLIATSNAVYFTAIDQASGTMTLYRTDGVPGDTTIVTSASPGPYDPNLGFTPQVTFNQFSADGNRLFYTISSQLGYGEYQLSLYVTDGSTPNPTFITNFGDISSINDPTSLIAKQIGGKIYVYYTTNTSNGGLLETDGTVAGTQLVSLSFSAPDGTTGESDQFYIRYVDALSVVDGKLIITAPAESLSGGPNYVGTDTFQYDPNTGIVTPDALQGAGALDGRAYVVYGEAVEQIDPALSQTTQIVGGYFSPYSFSLTVAGASAFFLAKDVKTGNLSLWATQGSSATAVELTSVSDPSYDIGVLTPVGNTLYFTIYNYMAGIFQLWVSDGTAAGTIQVSPPGTSFTSLGNLAANGGKLFFAATDAVHGDELWETDGTVAGTKLVDDIAPGASNSYPSQIIAGPAITTGVAVDGYIAGATVFADANGDGLWEAGEAKTTTDAQGHFSLQGGSGPLVLEGGVDLSTHLAFKGTLTAPSGSSVITPLTTLVQALLPANPAADDIVAAEAKVMTALGISLGSGETLTTLDPVAGTLGGDAGATSAYLAGAKIADVISIIGSALAGSSTPTVTDFNAVVTALAAAITGSPGQGLDLTNVATAGALIAAAATTLGGTSPPATTQAKIANAVVVSTTNLATAASQASGGATIVQAVSAVQQAAQSPAAPPAPSLTLTSLGAGAAPSVSGTAQPGATITLDDGATSIGTATADPVTGAFSITGTGLGAGEHILTATATDSFGHTSAASSPLIIEVGTAATIAAELDALQAKPGLAAIVLTGTSRLPVASVAAMNQLITADAAALAKIQGGYGFAITASSSATASRVLTYNAAGQLTATINTSYNQGVITSQTTSFPDGSSDAQTFTAGILTNDVFTYKPGSANLSDTKSYTGGIVTRETIVHNDKSKDVYISAIQNQSYVSEHDSYNAVGTLTAVLRQHADGSTAYTYALASNGTKTTDQYNSAGSLTTDTVAAADGSSDVKYYTNGALTAETLYFAPAAPDQSESRTFTAGVLTQDIIIHKGNSRDIYYYNLQNRSYTSEHDVYNAAGTLTSYTRTHADGTNAATFVLDASGTKTTNQYDAAGVLLSNSIVRADGSADSSTYSGGVISYETIIFVPGSANVSEAKAYTAGVLTHDTVLHAGGAKDTSTFGITGQSFVSEQDSYSATGTLTATIRKHADGSLAYTYNVSASGTKTTDQYNATGVITSESIQNADGSSDYKTYTAGVLSAETITFAPGSANISEAKVYTAGVLTRDTVVHAGGAKDISTFGITGQSFVSEQDSYSAAGVLTATIRKHADGSLAYTYNVSTSGSKTTDQYNAAGVISSESIQNPDGSNDYKTYVAGLLSSDTMNFAPGAANVSDLKLYTAGVLSRDTLTLAGGAKIISTFGITGQSYVAEQDSYNAAGTLTATVRTHADGSLAYSYNVSASGTKTTDQYNATGVITSESIQNPDGSTDTKAYSAGVLSTDTQVHADKSKDVFSYNLAGQPGASEHDAYNAAGSLTTTDVTNADGSHKIGLFAAGLTLTSNTGVVDSFTNSGPGSDTFVFNPSFGQDVISGFHAGAGANHDVIQIGSATLNQFSDLVGLMTPSGAGGADTLITIDPSDTILLKHVTTSSLTAQNFAFMHNA